MGTPECYLRKGQNFIWGMATFYIFGTSEGSENRNKLLQMFNFSMLFQYIFIKKLTLINLAVLETKMVGPK